MSCKSVPQECPASDPQECPTRVSHKSVPQECPTRVSHKSFLQECPTRVQECPTRVSYNSVLQECPSRVSHKSVIWTYVVFRMCFHSGSWVPSCFSPHLCVGFCFLGAIPPDSASPPLPPSLIHSLTHLLTHSLTLTQSVTHSLAHSLTHSHSLSHSLTRSLTHTPRATSSLITHSLTHSHSVSHSLTRSLTHSLSHSLTHSPSLTLTHSLTHSRKCRWLSSWQAQYPEPPRTGCGAGCRRWCRCLPSAWQAQYPEPPEGPAARVVAAGAAGCRRGRRSTQSLQKGLRRALSPLVPLPAFVAGAVPRASRRGCGAGCRRWCRCLPAGQAQYPEPPEGAAARVVAAGAAACLRGRRSTQSLPEGAAARVVAAGAAGCLRGRRSTQSVQKGLRRALSPLVTLAVFVAGAVPRASRRGCGARCRRWCRCLPSAWQAQYPEPPRRDCGAGCRRWCRCLPSAWQAQYPEPPEGPAARVVAAGAAGCPRGRRSTRASRRACGAGCRRWCRCLPSR